MGVGKAQEINQNPRHPILPLGVSWGWQNWEWQTNFHTPGASRKLCHLSVSRQWLQNSSIWYPWNRLQTLTERRHFCTCHKCWHILIFVLGGKYASVLTFVTHIVTHAYCQELLQNWSDPVYMFNCILLLSFASWGKASGQKSCSVLSNMITADLMCYCFYTGWQFA